MKIEFKPIGIIYTPYEHFAPFQPIEKAEGNFYIDLNEQFKDGLDELKTFSHVHVLFFLHESSKHFQLKVSPPWINHHVGVFATRSPRRPNGIGLSIVKLKRIENTRIYISGIDVFSGTPLLDIKPYFHDFDAKLDANNGWLDDIENLNELKEHFTKRFMRNVSDAR